MFMFFLRQLIRKLVSDLRMIHIYIHLAFSSNIHSNVIDIFKRRIQRSRHRTNMWN